MLKAIFIVISCATGILCWFEDKRADGEQELVTLERGDFQDTSDPTVGFSAFGKRYHVTLLPTQRERQPPVQVITSKKREWTAENNKDMEVYKDGDSVLMVMKRGGDIHVNGIVRQHGDEIFVESTPEDLSPSKRSQGMHMVTRADPTMQIPLKKDFMFAHEALGDWLRKRKRTSPSGQEAIVEVLVAVDNAAYRKFLDKARRNERAALDQIKNYYMLLIHLVDKRYTEIDDPEINIRVRLSALYIAQERESSLWSERVAQPSKKDSTSYAVDPTKTLNNFREWLAKERNELPNYDHAMAFTGYLLESSRGARTAGMAYIGTVCQLDSGYASSLVEEKGGLANVGTAVHELGHNLGATHDGEGASSRCSASNNNVMAPGSSAQTNVLKNIYTFSPCTLRQFRKLLGTEGAKCLYETASTNRGEAKTPPSTDLMNPDWQCKEVFGQVSGLCSMGGMEGANDICLRLWCISPDNPDGCITRGGLAALYGTPCGGDKVCRFGECTASEGEEEGGSPTNDDFEEMTPNNVQVQSPERDRERVAYAQRNGYRRTHSGAECRADTNVNYCRQLVYRRSDACRRPDISDYCCMTCLSRAMK